VLELPPGTKPEAQGGTREVEFVPTGVLRTRKIRAGAGHLYRGNDPVRRLGTICK
jgi:hypothetical protein